MNLSKLVTLLLISAALASAQGSHNVMQQVLNWPAGIDTTGKHWFVYNPDNPWIQVLTDTSVGSNTAKPGDYIWWIANTGNFPHSPPWTPGDTIIAFGSWDSCYANNPAGYSNNPNHTGFYWLFSDTLTTEEPQTFLPQDTLRPMPKPIAYIQNPTNDTDTIIIKIPNPTQTQSNLASYDIIGFELQVAQNSGILDNYKPIAFIPIQGNPGDTTVYKILESTFPNAATFYFAYQIVVRKN